MPKKPARRRPSGKAAVRSPQAKRGRPSGFSSALGDKLCELLAEGKTLREACRDLDQKESTVRGWALNSEHPFFAQYARAREIGVYAMVDEVVLIADDAQGDFAPRINQKGESYVALDRENIRRAELRVRSRQWIAERVLPAVFGPKVEVGGSTEKPLQVTHNVADEFISRIAGIAARVRPSEPSRS